MKLQRRFGPKLDGGHHPDQLEVRSGRQQQELRLRGGKFGGIGLTQSFALELVEYGIKVNAICPGNFFEGPLWSDPEKGLFVQYLRAGKVPGAKTVEDVRRSYESTRSHGQGLQGRGRAEGHPVPGGPGVRDGTGAARHGWPGHARIREIGMTPLHEGVFSVCF